ncbi:MAG TPA: helix-turn-helix transcriptional regulator [Pseudomonadales bacterium]|nr:helix-turn-helix transcriptional regulator [Pseudomonadales bacterium]
MKQKRMQFLLDITLPEGNTDTDPALPASNGDAAEWLNELKGRFPGLVATLSPVSKPAPKLRRPRKNGSFSSGNSSPANMTPSLDGFEELTVRQKDIVNLLFKGCSYREIGKSLGITLPTVRAHLHSVYKRLQVRSRAQAVAKIFRQTSENS